MANMAVLVRRQSSRELRPQKSYDRIELRELHGRLLSSDGNAPLSVNYGALNAAFKEEDGTTDPISEKGSELDDKGGKLKDGKLVAGKPAKKVTLDPGEDAVFTDEGEERESWDSKLTFLLATIGYAVGLGNVWRFPYLAQKNGGGAFLIPYFVMLAIEGMPIFFLELALGQRLRKGAIGVWNQVSPYLAGIGISSAVVSFNVALYYNTIISWCLLYFVKSFQNPLPWSSCPSINGTKSVECDKAGPTQYFWYRETLNISPDIEDPQNFNLQIAGALCVAWTLVYLCLAKGIASSTKVVYITAIFPYVVLVLFFCRGVTLKGMGDGILHLFTPKWQMLGEPRVWLEAGTQIFFSLGLGFGGLIAFASYNPVNNNCCRDAITVSLTNCFTSMFAGLVIFSVIGFKAHLMHDNCLATANKTIFEATGVMFNTPYPDPFTNVTVANMTVRIPYYAKCDLQDELDKTAQGPGLAFIIFTDAINQFSFSPFWSILFFSMLFTLGIDSQFGTLEGVVTSITDMKLFPNLRKEILTGVLCGICCALSMMFAHGSGNYIFFLFDSFAGNMPLLVIAFFECVGVSYVYGLSRFAEDIQLMTGRRPHLYWMICWKYISPVAIIIILAASWYNIIIDGSKYPRWDSDKAETIYEKWPNWALFMAVFLVLIAVIWIPIVACLRRAGIVLFSKEESSWFPADDLRDFHGIVAHEPTKMEKLLFGFHEDGSEGIFFRTKPRKDEEDDDDDPLT